MANKITKKDRFNQLLAIEAVAQNPELVEFINHELELLAKKNQPKDGEKKLTKEQIASMALADALYDRLLVNGNALTISEIISICPELADLSTNKVIALVTRLKNDGRVERSEIKRKAYFKAIA